MRRPYLDRSRAQSPGLLSNGSNDALPISSAATRRTLPPTSRMPLNLHLTCGQICFVQETGLDATRHAFPPVTLSKSGEPTIIRKARSLGNISDPSRRPPASLE